MKKKYDVIVVGAGPAGCSASYFIARRGYEVLLIDKAKFPRDKACGDAISALALDVLDRMDVSGKIEGKIIVLEQLSLKTTSIIKGDVIASKLAIEPGAKFTGNCNMSGNIELQDEQKPEQKIQKEQTKL